MDWLIFALLMLIPWIASFGGSIFALKISLASRQRQDVLLGFAAGIMLASSVFSLIIPAFDHAGKDLRGAIIVSIGFLIGCVCILSLDKILPHQHNAQAAPEGRPSHLTRPMLLAMAVALHNIPEGLALGIVLSAAMQPGGITLWLAISFGIGLALQNFPEGMAVVLPMRQAGITDKKVLFFGVLSSFAEPVAALIGFFLASVLSTINSTILPIMLSVAGGAMVFIIVEELIPESQAGGSGHGATYGFLVGFWIMVVMGIIGT